MNKQLKIYRELIEAVTKEKYKDLGKVKIEDGDNINIIKIKNEPYEGFHKNEEYLITLNFIKENNWPIVHIDSKLFNQIKTRQYIENKGFKGVHKGICIKNLSYCYNFSNNFNKICNNKWDNYLYYVICMFNNFEDFISGNGIKSNYKQILNF